MIRSYEDWSFDKVFSFNYPNEFRVQDLLTTESESSIQLLYQVSPCRVKDYDRDHACSYRAKCKNYQQDSSSNMDDDLSSSNYLVSSDDEEGSNNDEVDQQ